MVMPPVLLATAADEVVDEEVDDTRVVEVVGVVDATGVVEVDALVEALVGACG